MGRTLAVVGGSGLYDLPGLEGREELVVETPYGAPSDAIVRGRIGDTTLLFLARHGRGHRIQPHRIEYRANVFALKRLGAEFLLSVSAVGSLREEVAPGEFVVVDQFIDATKGRVSTFFDLPGCVVHVSLADPVDSQLSAALRDAAREVGATVHERGTYVCIEGPQFGSRAESEMFRTLSATVVGMTNAPEYKLAREAELPFATLAMATDYDCWKTDHAAVTVDDVIAVMHRNVARARLVIAALAARLPDPSTCPATRALDSAILSDPIDADARARLAPLLDRALAARSV